MEVAIEEASFFGGRGQIRALLQDMVNPRGAGPRRSDHEERRKLKRYVRSYGAGDRKR
jgi:hypothetical protein